MSALSPLQPTSTAAAFGLAGNVNEYVWAWAGQQLPVIYETLGQGPPVLLLPAFSTVSTRAEMRGLAERLASQFQVTALDWPGFGQSPRPPLDYRPALYHQFLKQFVKAVFDIPIGVVAAGHAAGYVMHLAQQAPQALSRIVLVAPTWRGPLTTMGEHRQLYKILRNLVRTPLVGQALYKLNTTPSFLSLMYRRHVYADAAKVTPGFIQPKYHTTQQPGARFAPAAFVTGALDPVRDRSELLSWFQSVSMPLMVVVGEQSPAKSKAEMEALAELPGVEFRRLPGSLGLHEEYAAEVAEGNSTFFKT